AFPLPARRLPSCPACSVLPRSTPVRCHSAPVGGLVDASDAEVIHIGETGSALALVVGRVHETETALAFRKCH
ncbi:hypothetical protein ND910_10155, partial [Schaalia meyeri]|uniref:hypothetical protein n=1 Tax=Schaalia meyeri TaxID=52773 RepID=UPI0020449C49